MPAVVRAIVGAAMIVVGLIFFPPLAALGAAMILGTAASALTKKPSSQSMSAKSEGYKTTVRQPAAPWRIIYGRARVGGILTFVHLTGTDNAFMHMVITICKGKINQIGTMYFSGESVPLDGSGDATGKYAGYVHVVKSLGDPADASQPFADLVTAAPTKWTSNHLQRGHAKVWVRLKWNADLFPSGVPNITFDVKGREIYDPRTSTTIYSENPAICLRDYHTNAQYGIGAATAEINDTAGNAAANVCDEDVNLNPSGTEDRYTANGAFDTSEKPVNVIKDLLTAMAGDYTYVGGLFAWYAGAWRAPSVTLTDGDFRGPLKVQTRLSRREIFNAVKGIYLSPVNNWQPSDFPPVTNSTYETEDGERIYRDVEYPYTVSSATAQRIGKIELETARQQITVMAQCKLSAYAIQPPDVIQLTHPRFGWTNKNFKVINVQLVPDIDQNDAPILGVDLTLRETDSTVYGWTSAEEQQIVAPPLTTLPDLSAVQPPTGLALASSAATSLLRADGARISRIKVTWTAPSDQFVQSGGRVVFEYKKSADSVWLPAGSVPGTAVEHYITGVDDAVAYDVHCWAENAAGSKSAVVAVTNHTVSSALLISANASYRPLTNPLTATDAGASATVSIAAFTMRFPGTDISINSGSVSGLSFNSVYYIYYVDTGFDGGAVTYGASTTKDGTLVGAAYFYVGSIVTPRDGAPDTAGADDGGATNQVAFSMNLALLDQSGNYEYGNGVLSDTGNVNDGNQTSYGTATVTGNAGNNFADFDLRVSGTPVRASWKSLKLKILSSVPTNSLNGSGNVFLLQYTLDGGSTWPTIRVFTPGQTIGLTLDSVDLSFYQAMQFLRVMLRCECGASQTTGALVGRLYEAWIEQVI